jgi:hypothetical protein
MFWNETPITVYHTFSICMVIFGNTPLTNKENSGLVQITLGIYFQHK